MENPNHPVSSKVVCYKFNSKTDQFYLNNSFKQLERLDFKFTQISQEIFEFKQIVQQLPIIINSIDIYNSFINPLKHPRDYSWSKPHTVISFLTSIIEYFQFSFSKQLIKSQVFYYPSQQFILLNHVNNLQNYLIDKHVFINPKFINKEFKIKPNRSLKIPKAFIIKKQGKSTIARQGLVLLIKNNINGLWKSIIRLKEDRPELRFIKGRDRPNYIQTSSSYDLILVKIYQKQLQSRKIMHQLKFKNIGANQIYFLNATLDNYQIKNNLIKLHYSRPRLLKSNQTMSISYKMYFTQKAISYYRQRLFIHCKEQIFHFQLIIKFQDFYILGNTSQILIKYQEIIYVTLGILIIYKVVKSIRQLKGRKELNFARSTNQVKFLQDSQIKDKILVYNFQRQARKKKEKKQKQFIEDQINNTQEQVYDQYQQTNCRNNQAEKNQYSVINNQPNPNTTINEISLISVENICKLLEKERSSSDENKKQRRQFMSTAKTRLNPSDIKENYGQIGQQQIQEVDSREGQGGYQLAFYNSRKRSCTEEEHFKPFLQIDPMQFSFNLDYQTQQQQALQQQQVQSNNLFQYYQPIKIQQQDEQNIIKEYEERRELERAFIQTKNEGKKCENVKESQSTRSDQQKKKIFSGNNSCAKNSQNPKERVQMRKEEQVNNSLSLLKQIKEEKAKEKKSVGGKIKKIKIIKNE